MRKPSASTIGVIAGLLSLAAAATDTAFWEPYVADDHTYALIQFDEPAPLTGQGKLAGEGRLGAGAALTPEGRFGGGLKLDGAGAAVFASGLFDPQAMAIHFANRSFSLEAWIKLDRLPAAGQSATIVYRPDKGGNCVGFSLMVDEFGALGMTVWPLGGKDATLFRSAPGVVPVGAWAHVAGVANSGFLSVGRCKLYVNGVEVYDGAASPAAAGYGVDREAADLFIGGMPDGGNSLAGVVDAVRVHGLVGKFWAPEAMPWLARIAADGLLSVEDVLAPGRGPTLTFPFDGDPQPVAAAEVYARDPALVERFKVSFAGEYVPGVSGQAARGRLAISGYRLADLREGSLEVWARPYRINSISDRQRGLFESSAMAAYFHNSVNADRRFSFYYRDREGNLRMHGDALGTEFHPGRWYHLVFAWDVDRVVMYVDGQAAASGGNGLATEANQGLLDSLAFNSHAVSYDIDEMAVYEHRLTDGEVANRYWSVVEPARMAAVRTPAPIRLEAWRFPSQNEIVYRMLPGAGLDGVDQARLRLADEQGGEILAVERPFTEPGEFGRLAIPALPEGRYIFDAGVAIGGEERRSAPIPLLVQRFAWEGNRLGISDEVFTPFEPVRAAGDKVSVVLRDYRINGFGLWDSVVSQGRELLAAPMRLRYETADGGEGEWRLEQPVLEAAEPHRACYRTKATGEAVVVEAVCEVEMDGMMKVRMVLGPLDSRLATSDVRQPVPDMRHATPVISRLWLEVPLKASEARLMHEDTGSMRNNYSGEIPVGEGVVWQARRRGARHGGSWLNAFCGYLWLGGEERGIAWFAENDRGWMTEKGWSDKPLQEIVREGEVVVLRVHLVNTPAAVAEGREIVFGLQASPAKPMPADWRTGERGGGLPVTPWGGHQCADKFPFEDRWEIVDKIIETQLEGKDNGEWFREYQKEHDIPPLRGTEDWLKSVGHFAGHPHYQNRPVLVYHEEMAASTYRPEWHVYKDEWSAGLLDPRQAWPAGYDLFRQGRLAGGAQRANFGSSYRDYGVWYANEWLKRGVGIYWDNTYLTTASNPLTSAAYRTEDGQIQPALTLWNQREYSRRVWNVMQHWRRERGEKQLFLQHMTNAALLPILSWTTTAFDNEFSAAAYSRNVGYPHRHDPQEPLPADYLRAQSLGRQFGCYPALCHQLFSAVDFGLAETQIPERERQGGVYGDKRNWGLARVHEIPGGGFASARFEAALRGFGYGSTALATGGTAEVVVHNYWAEKPVLRIDDAKVKWLVVARPADRRLLVILQSWSRQPGRIEVHVDYEALGFRPTGKVVNLETGEVAGEAEAGRFGLALDAPYDLRLLGFGVPPSPAGVRFADDFADGASPRWNYVSSFFQTPVDEFGRRVLRLADNKTSWQGPPRLELWDGLEGWRDGTFEIEFRPAVVPEERTMLLEVVTRAGRPVFSQHGLSHTRLGDGQFMQVFANPEKGQYEMVRWTLGVDGKRGRAESAALGPLVAGVHTLALVMRGETTVVHFDGVEVATLAGTPTHGGACGIRGGFLSEQRYVEVRRVTLRE